MPRNDRFVKWKVVKRNVGIDPLKSLYERFNWERLVPLRVEGMEPESWF